MAIEKDLQTGGGGCCRDVEFKVGGVASLSVRFQSSGDWRRAAPQPGVGLLTKLELTLRRVVPRWLKITHIVYK